MTSVGDTGEVFASQTGGELPMAHRPAPIVMVSLLLLVISVGVNAFQAKRIGSLLSGESSVGRVAPMVTGVDPSGRTVTLPAAAVPSVFYYFSSTCKWCERNWSNIRVLSQEQGLRYRIVALSSGDIDRAYLSKRQLNLLAIGKLDERARAAFGFRGTPHTVVVSSDGVVTHDWPGAFVPKLQRRIEHLFQLTLPGLAPDPNSIR